LKEILFVCSGNTCRSPLAEGLAKKLIANGLPFEARISSAGSSATEGQRASANALEVSRANGIDLSGHRSRLLNATMVRRADLIVTMGELHRHTVGVIEPTALDHTVQLTDFCDSHDGDIADPIGGDLAAYERIFDTIRECVEEMAEKIAADDFDGWRVED
jgi:protein-tyrosine-phosphatase